MRIELLVFEGCPNTEPARDLLKAGMTSLGIAGEIQEIRVETPAAARQWNFPGSPTLRVNGEDVAPLPEAFEPALGCRTYMVQGRRQGLPDQAWVLEALRKGQVTEAHDCCPPNGIQAGTCSTQSPDQRPKAEGRTMLSAVLLGVAASACCWLPLALAVAGVATGTLGAKISWIRPWALGALVLFLAGVIVWWAMKRFSGASKGGDCCAVPPPFPMLPVVILGLSLLGAAAAPRLLRPGGNSAVTVGMLPAPAGGTLLVISTPQFDCLECVGKLPQSMSASSGVASVQMDFDKRETRIVFKPGAAVEATLVQWKKELGFEGKEIRREFVSDPRGGASVAQ